MFDLTLRAFGLKDEDRSGWLLRGVHNPESVADHSWGTALLCLLHGADVPGVDRERAVRVALVHDLAEAITGDTATRVAIMDDAATMTEKRRREESAMTELLAGLDGDRAAEIRSLWEEYEERVTPTAMFVRDMNLIDMCAQALIYERAHRYNDRESNPHFPDFQGLDEFFATSRPRLSTGIGRRLFDELAERYDALESVQRRGGLRTSARVRAVGSTRPSSGPVPGPPREPSSESPPGPPHESTPHG